MRSIKLGRYCHMAESYHVYGYSLTEFEGQFLGALRKRTFEQRTKLENRFRCSTANRSPVRSQIRAEVAIIATGGQRTSIEFLFGRRVEDLPLKLCVLRFDFDVLDDDDFILLTFAKNPEKTAVGAIRM